jgi:hypothetical protein
VRTVDRDAAAEFQNMGIGSKNLPAVTSSSSSTPFSHTPTATAQIVGKAMERFPLPPVSGPGAIAGNYAAALAAGNKARRKAIGDGRASTITPPATAPTAAAVPAAKASK